MAGASARNQNTAVAVPRQHILLHFGDAPLSVGLEFERILRQDHDVTALDSSCPEAKPHVGAERRRSLYLWIESYTLPLPTDLESLEVPTVGYFTGARFDEPTRLEAARRFHFVFVAQRSWWNLLAQAGLRNVAWLPLACSEEICRIEGRERVYDVACLTALQEIIPEDEARLLVELEARFPNSRFGKATPSEIAKTYASSKIVVNVAAYDEISPRVFEAMGAGALLISTHAEGLDDLFLDGVHCIYASGPSAIAELVERYLDDGATRERIAGAGRALVRERHTYPLRAERLLVQVLESLGRLGGGVGEARYHFGGYYCSPRLDLLPYIPSGVRRVLDVGCGAGEFGRVLKLRGAIQVVGVELDDQAARMAQEVLDDVILGNIEEVELPYREGYFDCIICGDVLEHLVDPWKTLDRLHRFLAPAGFLVISIPNVGYYEVLRNLARGRWVYLDHGILDRTHLRFFTGVELRRMLESAGFELLQLEPLCLNRSEELALDQDGCMNLPPLRLGPLSAAQHLQLCTYQYVATAQKLQGDILAAARRAFEEGDYEQAYRLAESAPEQDSPIRGRLLAQSSARLGHVEKAEQLCRHILERRPDDLDAAAQLGVLLVKQERTAEAKPFLEKAVESGVEDEAVFRALGQVALLESRNEDAFGLLKQALDLDFGNEESLENLVRLGAELNQFEQIEPYLRKFVEFYPGNLEMSWRYAQVLYRLGRRHETAGILERVLLWKPDHSEAQEMLRSIQGSPS